MNVDYQVEVYRFGDEKKNGPLSTETEKMWIEYSGNSLIKAIRVFLKYKGKHPVKLTVSK